MSKRKFHMKMDIIGFMGKSDAEVDGVINGDNGRPLSARAARIELSKLLHEGQRYLPLGECDNFDPQKGCMGHVITEG